MNRNAQEVCQTMLDRYGFFVLCYAFPVEIGHVQKCMIWGEPIGEAFQATVAVVAEASAEDFAKQCAIAGLDPRDQPDSLKYRAVAE